MTGSNSFVVANEAWFRWGKDYNGDGIFTIGDVWGWVATLYFLPGDFVLRLVIEGWEGEQWHIGGVPVGEFLELSPE